MVVIKAASRVGSRLIRLSAIAMVAAVFLTGCASTQYMGIPLQSDAADPKLQELAIKAKDGDKQAQYELGRWFEDSSDPRGLKKAIKLYRIAATPRGGMRLLYAPGPTGVTTSIVHTGARVESHKDAQARLSILESQNAAAPNGTSNQSSGDIPYPTQNAKQPNQNTTSLPEELIINMIKIEVFSDFCLGIAKGKRLPEHYLEEGWSCVLKSKLPTDCSFYADAVMKVARIAKLHPNFKVIRIPAEELLKKCVFVTTGSTVARPSTQPISATVLDFLLQEVGGLNAEEVKRLEEDVEAGQTHSSFREYPGVYFPYKMCARLFSGQEISSPSVWILMCSGDMGPHRSEVLNNLLIERGSK